MACPADGSASLGSTQYGLPRTTEEEFLFFAGEKPFPLGENLFPLGENPFPLAAENLFVDSVTDSLSSAPLRLLLQRLGESASTANP